MAQNPLSVTAPVFDTSGMAGLEQQRGQMRFDVKAKEKAEKDQLQGDYDAMMASVQSFSDEAWEYDMDELGSDVDNLMTELAGTFESAYNSGRRLSLGERARINNKMGALQRKFQISAQNKDTYTKYANHILQNPDKYDVEASIQNLQQGYRDKELGARELGAFAVSNQPAYDPLSLIKDVSPVVKFDTRGGLKYSTSKTYVSEEETKDIIRNRFKFDPNAQKYVLENWQKGFYGDVSLDDAVEMHIDTSYNAMSKPKTGKSASLTAQGMAGRMEDEQMESALTPIVDDVEWGSTPKKFFGRTTAEPTVYKNTPYINLQNIDKIRENPIQIGNKKYLISAAIIDKIGQKKLLVNEVGLNSAGDGWVIKGQTTLNSSDFSSENIEQQTQLPGGYMNRVFDSLENKIKEEDW